MKCQTRQSENNNKFRQDDVSVMDLLLCRCLLERNATKERRLLESTQDSSFSFTRGKFDKHNRIYQTLTGDRQETVQGNETSVIITLSVYNISVTTVIETRECKHLLFTEYLLAFLRSRLTDLSLWPSKFIIHPSTTWSRQE